MSIKGFAHITLTESLSTYISNRSIFSMTSFCPVFTGRPLPPLPCTEQDQIPGDGAHTSRLPTSSESTGLKVATSFVVYVYPFPLLGFFRAQTGMYTAIFSLEAVDLGSETCFCVVFFVCLSGFLQCRHFLQCRPSHFTGRVFPRDLRVLLTC